MQSDCSIQSINCILRLLQISVKLSKEAQHLCILHSVILLQRFQNCDLLLHTLDSTSQVIVTVVSYSKLIVEIRDILADFGSCDLLFDLDGFHHNFLRSAILLLLTQLNCHSLHCPSLVMLSLCAF